MGRNKMRVIPLLGKLGKIESKNEELRMETTSLTTTRHAAQMLIFVISKINRTFQRLPFLNHTCDILFSLHLFCICRWELYVPRITSTTKCLLCGSNIQPSNTWILRQLDNKCLDHEINKIKIRKQQEKQGCRVVKSSVQWRDFLVNLPKYHSKKNNLAVINTYVLHHLTNLPCTSW